MQIDISKTSSENVFALIVASNPGTPVNGENVTLGDPVLRTPSQDNPRNTTVTITAIPNNPDEVVGTSDINYTRLGMNSGVEDPSFDFTTQTSTTPTTFKTQVATALGIKEDEITITGTLPTVGNTGEMQLIANELSYLYVGSQTLNVTCAAPAPN